MTERGILFSAPMVRALQGGSKTQTRRAVKSTGADFAHGDAGRSPYGHVGDRLWVRETFFAFGRWATRFNERKGRDEWAFVDMTAECNEAYRYAADEPDLPLAQGRSRTPAWHARPALFMPRAASRILLDVTGVRVERLQDISEADAMAEGVGQQAPDDATAARDWYAGLWERINGAGSWDANPWVWVVTFEQSKGPRAGSA
jgi:hypothetical protein